MTFAEKCRQLRKSANLSQEELAEKLNVSRQAITKWETDGGIPDIENLMALARLFHITVDELLSPTEHGSIFESVTAYDVDRAKHFDVKLGAARRVSLCGYDGEQLYVRLSSDRLEHIARDFKCKIDDKKSRLDLDLIGANHSMEEAKAALDIDIRLPQKYLNGVELSAIAEQAEVRAVDCDNIELDLKTTKLTLENVPREVEVNCNLDMTVVCKTLCSRLSVNQINASSRLHVPKNARLSAVTKGIGTRIIAENGAPLTEEAECAVELNGYKSQLTVSGVL